MDAMLYLELARRFGTLTRSSNLGELNLANNKKRWDGFILFRLFLIFFF